ncbi:MAG: lipid-A-disaccharide synthase [bacterium]
MVKQDVIHIAIVAGEPSGDRLGAGLIREVREKIPNVQFSGIGGPKMADQGCELLYQMDRIGVIGLDGLREKLLDILRIRKQLSTLWQQQRPAVFVGVDVPDFNIGLEQRLKQVHIPCIHYVSPTVWAWRGYRIHKIKRSISHMLALFPFEADFYRHHQVPVTCVGHPLADEISEPDPAAARNALNIDLGPAGPSLARPGLARPGLLIALLPGSRRSEVKRLALPLIKAARVLLSQYPEIRFVLPFATDKLQKTFHQTVGSVEDLPLITLHGQSRLALEAADVAVLASGTASLEAALLRVPHVVVYRLSGFSHWLVQRLRQVDHFAMPNHLLPEPMVPELIQDRVTPENIVEAVNGYLQNPEHMKKIKHAFADIHKALKLDADKRAAEVVISMLGKSAS